ncbi:MAG: chromosome segregation protein SMC [Thermomicrobium sp.]|nr:chromosome segregation protein SMC [Thermomicrobium sp.]
MAVRLKRLSLLGFKSFADPVELVFDPGITAIVGPNGSGKSNLAEAIAWVLGEQSGAAVRGRRGEDVIFAGGPGRAGLGMAEVTLVLEQDEEELGLPFREVSLTRRVFRDGENQYLVNGARARLRDVLRIAAALRADWIIVRQGAVDRVLDQRPTERREYLEHAAGLTALRLRQAEARQQLAEAEHHAGRLEDLLQELEPHVRSLAVAAERAREALAVRAALREATLHLFAARWARARAETAQLQARLATLEAEYAAAQRADEECARRWAEQRRARDELRSQRERLARRREETAARLREVRHEADLARTRAAALAAQLAALTRDHARARDDSAALDEEAERLAATQQALADEFVRLERELQRYEAELAERQRRAEAIRAELAALEREQERLAGERERCTRERAALLAAREARRQELARLDAAIAEYEQELRARVGEGEHVAHRLALVERRLTAARSEVERRSAQLARASAELEQRSRTVWEVERELVVTRTKLEALAHALEADLLASAPRAVLAAAKRGELRGIVGTLGALLEVPAELETAIEAALGHHLHDIVVERWSDAEAAIAYLKAHRAGRATFHPLDTVRAAAPARLPLVQGQPGIVGIAAELVAAPPPLQPIVRALLGRVLVVADLPTTRRVLPQLPPGWTIVTREGEIARPTGSVTGGAGRTRERGVLSSARERRLLAERSERLARVLDEAQRELATAAAQHDEARAQLHAGREAMEALERERKELLAFRERLDRERAALADRLERAERSTEELRSLLEKDDQRIGQLAQRETELSRALEALALRRAELDREVTALAAPDSERERLARELVTVRERLDAVTRERDRVEQQIARLASVLREFSERSTALESEHAALLKAVDRAEEEATTLAADVADLDRQEATLAEALEQCDARLAALEHERTVVQDRVRSLERALAQARAALERATDAERNVLDAARWELAWNGERSALLDELVAVSDKIGEPPERLERTVAELRRRWQGLSRFGEAAIAQYESERTRYEQLRAELEDVRATIRTLRKLLADLDRQIERGFARSLRALDQAFAATFAELFGGGRARLVARDRSGAIEGVELVVQPAGKRVRSIQQLSGGERALTAIALRFALLHLDPLPFCVLDEVDAALDEANVLRFRGLLERLATRTQFLVVTHNRTTIEAAGALYGVTMGDDGCSRVVSLRLAEYVCEDR